MGPVRFIVEAFCRCGRRFSPSPRNKKEAALQLGRRGESLAARHLRRNGYKILYKNFRAPHGGEVDLVCREKCSDTLIFVEVKTRSSGDFGGPAAAVDLKKQRLIARGALAWLRLLGFPAVRFRFDIVEVIVEEGGTSFQIIRNAFPLPEPLVY